MNRFKWAVVSAVIGVAAFAIFTVSMAHQDSHSHSAKHTPSSSTAQPESGHRSDTHDDHIDLSDAQVEAGRFGVEAVGGGTLSRRLTVPGSIVPSGNHIAKASVRLLGTVSELRARLGDSVTRGDVIAVIESREVADAKSEYLAARVVFDLQQTLFSRARSLFESKVQSENEFLRARSTFEDAKIKLEVARQKLFALGLTEDQIVALPQQPVETLRQQELRAPISGRIAERRVELGSLVGREGQESELFTIVDLSTVWADIAVAQTALADIREGQQLRISLGAQPESLPATVIFVSPLLDRETRSGRVVASIDNTAMKLRPGAYVTADILIGEHAAEIVVPKTALQFVSGMPVVFVRTSDGFEARKIVLGRDDGDRAEVTAGLIAGDALATTNTFVLKAELGKKEADHAH